MRFDDFDAEIPGLAREWDSWFLDSSSLDSFLTLESGLSNGLMLDSIASVGMSSWVDVQRNLGANASYGVQVTGGVVEGFISAASSEWNIGQGGVVSGIFEGLPNPDQALDQALRAFGGDGVDADALAGALGKAALGIALGVVSAAVPVVGAVAGLVAGAVTLIVREYREAKGDSYAVPQSYLPTSGATAATCSSGSANAADEYMMRLIRESMPVFAAVGGTRGIPTTTGDVEKAAKLTDLTSIFLPDVIPSGRTSPEIEFADSMEDGSLVRGVTRHPRAPGDRYFYAGEPDTTAKPGELYVTQDLCPDTRRAFVRVGVARNFGSLGVGWTPGRGAFSGPEYWVGVRGPQRGKAAGGTGKNGNRNLPAWPHEKIGLEANVKQSRVVSAAEMFPASSAFMASLERQVMSAPGCFLVSPLEILLYWRQWQSGMQELAERVVWEGYMLPGSISRAYYAQGGPTSYLCQPHGWLNCSGSAGDALRPPPGVSTFVLGPEDVANVPAATFFRQAAAWRVKRQGRWVVESTIDAGSLDALKWQDGDPFRGYPTLAGARTEFREMYVPDKIYAFRDPTGRAADKGTTGYYGPVVDLIVEPWANSIAEMQKWALKTLQVAYVTQESPAIQKDSLLRGEMQARREQLLGHSARFKVKVPDVLDNVGPESYLAKLKASGVGKMGAGSLASAPTAGAELEPGAGMPTPEIPEPVAPGFTSAPQAGGPWPLILGAVGGFAALGALLRR